MTRAAEAGFTLIETLVALVVLATSAVALLGATEAHIARIGDLEVRAAALWAAENMIAEMTLGLDPDVQPDPILGIDLAMSVQYYPTSDSDLTRVDVTASDANGGQEYSRLIGFLDIGGTE